MLDLFECKIKSIDLVIYNNEATIPYERFTFQMKTIQDQHKECSLSFEQIELYFRSFFVKINYCSTTLSKLPEDITFRIYIELIEGTPSERLTSWIIGSEEETAMDEKSTIHPIKTLDCGVLKLQLFVRESNLKPNMAQVS
ncbi:MAD2 mitotic arrest deficient-like 2 [Lobulomyces angularis]|nr:MAD2 mitotic arrest deficient-like 2 [Lobulomyces angularis]